MKMVIVQKSNNDIAITIEVILLYWLEFKQKLPHIFVLIAWYDTKVVIIMILNKSKSS